jgi:phthalate 4,5-dioxygenase
MRAEQNQLLTRIGPGSDCGQLLRQYWQPIALVDEFDAHFDARMAQRPLKAVRALGQDFVLFRDANLQFKLFDRDCPHRGADLAFGRLEPDGLRCPFHGWKFASDGQCIETPGEPKGSTLCTRIQQRSYSVQVSAGIVWAWLSHLPATTSPLPPLPALDCFRAPASHSFAFKGLWHANWLQCVEVGIDPAHPSFLHRFFADASLEDAYGKQFRGASAGDIDGERWPMSRIMRESCSPEIHFDARPWGFEIKTLRPLTPKKTHVRVTQSIFPQAFLIPLSETVTITQWHLPVDDTHTYWYSVFTSLDQPLDKTTMREQRLRGNPAPDFLPQMGRHNDWGFNAQEQATRTFLGMGEDDINVHDQWAVESMGPIADRTREHLGTTDKVIIANRRKLQAEIDALKTGQLPLHSAFGEHQTTTVDGIAPANAIDEFWQATAHAKRQRCPW